MALLIKNLTKSFSDSGKSGVLIFKNLNFEVKSGSVLRLTGCSGSGKTTFMNVVSAIIPPDSGSVFVDGVEITTLSESQKDRFRAEKVGYVFQTFNLISPFSVIENVYAPLAFAGKLKADYYDKALESLRKVNMAQFAGKSPYHLSVGQKQRVAIARALFADSSLILADEPTASLDKESSKLVYDALIELREKGKTLIFASHDRIFDDFKSDLTLNLEEGKLL